MRLSRLALLALLAVCVCPAQQPDYTVHPDAAADLDIAPVLARADADNDRWVGEQDYEALGQAKTMLFLERLPELRQRLATDVQAAYDGDPACKSLDEVIFCYPGLEAITIYRLAHLLYELDIPFIPRMMTEWAHSKTGIDIHPGATIGDFFFIDHGTGVVGAAVNGADGERHGQKRTVAP